MGSGPDAASGFEASSWLRLRPRFAIGGCSDETTLRAWAVLETLSGSVANRRPAVVAEMMRRDRSEVAPAGRNLVQQEIDRLDPARVEVLPASSWPVRLTLGSCEGDAEEGMAAQP